MTMKGEKKKGVYCFLLTVIVSVFLMFFSIRENNGLLIIGGMVAIISGFSLLIGGAIERYKEKREE